MELLLQEKKVKLHNCEEETRQYLVKILDSTRNIKILRKTLDSIDKAKLITSVARLIFQNSIP